MRKQQIFLVTSCVVLVAALYFFGQRTVPNRATLPQDTTLSTAEHLPKTEINIQAVVQNLKKRLPNGQRDSITFFEQQLDSINGTDKQLPILQDLVACWERARYIEIAAYYRKRIAQLDSTKQNWQRAADDLGVAFRISGDSTLQLFLLENAIYAYQTALQFPADTNETQLKTNLASCYIDGYGMQSNKVMQGVFLLREVVEADTANVLANILLGRMSIVSGQYERAIQRLNTAIRHDGDNAEAFFYLGDAYIGINDKENAISAFEQCKKLVKNPTFASQLEKRIQKYLPKQ